MPWEEHIQELCTQIVAEQDPEKLATLLTQLTTALREHRRETEALLYLHRKLLKDAV